MTSPAVPRRTFVRLAGVSAGACAAGFASTARVLAGPDPAPSPEALGIEVLHPRDRVPLSFIIDDSTCLVNMGHFCMPQFAQAWPNRDVYKQPWRDWPREIPDRFVREFGQWCHAHGVKGKYSIVPAPACVGYVDRFLPGWSKQELDRSLTLVRELMMPDWDIHPEMITHTRVIDLKTGRPLEQANAATMENSFPQTDISVDHLASYLAYALKILKNSGLECEGITTPGGFGNRVKAKLPIAVHQAVRDVYGTELPHYFKYIANDRESTRAKLEYINATNAPEYLTMNVPAATGDWFGGWEGTRTPEPDRYCTADASAGRMVDLIKEGRPAVMLCHWPGMYCNGTKAGFQAFQRVVLSLADRFGDQTIWMKVSQIGRYEAVRQLATFSMTEEGTIRIESPFACDLFTFRLKQPVTAENPCIRQGSKSIRLQPVDSPQAFNANTFLRENGQTKVCVQLSKGVHELAL